MLHVDALSRNPLPMMINESSESIHAKIGKAQREDSDIEKNVCNDRSASVRRLYCERRIIV